MAQCSSRRLVRGMGSVLGQHWWYRVMSCPGLAWYPSWRCAVNHRVCFPLLKTIALQFVMSSLNLELRTALRNSCIVISCNVKYDGDCISGLTFVWGNLIWSCVSVVYRDVTRQAKGLYRLKHVGALASGLAYLSRYNSGWFCHNVRVFCLKKSRDLWLPEFNIFILPKILWYRVNLHPVLKRDFSAGYLPGNKPGLKPVSIWYWSTFF
jgi:hypothetical protein